MKLVRETVKIIIKLQVDGQITDLSFYCILEKCPTFLEMGFVYLSYLFLTYINIYIQLAVGVKWKSH